MHRLVVALLAAFDALIAAAVGVVAVLAPLTVFWATGLQADWSALWPTTAAIWQSGHFVPLVLHLPHELVGALGLPAEAATFVFSLAPLAFAGFAAVFAARSGGRAARSGAWLTGVLFGGATFAALGALIWWTSRNGTAAVWGWQALLFPALAYGVPLLVGALVGAWREGDDGRLVDRLHDWIDDHDVAWSELPSLAGRGLGLLLASFIALGALAVTVAVAFGAAEAVALFQSAQVDLWGAILISLAQLAYIPNLVVWGFAWISGSGFSLGTGATITPAATHLGVVPGIPVLGILPEHGSVWLLACALLPVLAAAATGWVLRSRYVRVVGAREPLAPRAVLLGILVLGSAGAVALAAWLSGGSLGPGLLAAVGPHPGWTALAVGLEVLVGAGILLLAPRRADDQDEPVPARVRAVEAPLAGEPGPGASGGRTKRDARDASKPSSPTVPKPPASRAPKAEPVASPKSASGTKPKPRAKPKPAPAPEQHETVTDLDEVRAIIDAAEAAERSNRGD